MTTNVGTPQENARDYSLTDDHRAVFFDVIGVQLNISGATLTKELKN